MSKNPRQVLHLFSSDYRSLYLKDCLDVLALPAGAVHRFRYARGLVWTGGRLPKEVDDDWSKLARSNCEVIIYFVATRTRRYGTDVYIPLRWGRVIRSFVQGDFLFVDFKVGSYVDPLAFRMAEGDSVPSGDSFTVDSINDSFEARQEWARGVTSSMREALDGRFPGGGGSVKPPHGAFSAVIGAPPAATGKVHADQQSAAFSRLVSVMHDLVGAVAKRGTVDGSVLAFFRVLGVRASGGTIARKAPFNLRAAKHYQLEILHLNPAGIGPDSLTFVAPDPLLPTTDSIAAATGRYDVIPFEFGVKPKEDTTSGKLSVSNLPPEKAKQATQISVSIPFKAKPRKSFIAMSWVIAVGTTLAAFLLALNSMRAVVVSPPNVPAQYVDLSELVGWLTDEAYLAVSAGAIIPAAVTAVAAGLIAVGAVFRRHWGLSTGGPS